MTGIKVGDEVRVFPGCWRPGYPAPDEGYPATVTKVGRRYATAQYAHGTAEFDIATGRERGAQGNYCTHVESVQQAEQDARRRRAEDALRSIGLAFTATGHRERLTLEQIEALADLARSFTEGED